MLPPAAALVSVLLLVGCVPSDPIIAPEPEPNATPVFASDEEALAAATEAYAKYLSVTDRIFQDGILDFSELSEVSTGDLLNSTRDGFSNAKSRNWHSVGNTTFDQVRLQQYDGTTNEGMVVAYICEDDSAVDVLDSSNHSVVSPDRPDRVLYEVTFDLSEKGSSLLVSDRDVWSAEQC